jgi:hypothetical protein
MPASETLEILVKVRDLGSKPLNEFNEELKETEKLTRDVSGRLRDAQGRFVKTGKEISKTSLVLKKFNIDLSRAKAGLAKIRGGLQGAVRGLFSLKGAIAGAGIGLIAKSFLNAADTAEQYRTRLTVLLGSVKEGNRLFSEMSGFASEVSFEYQEIMGSATTLSGVMKGGVDEVKEWMPLIADLAAASGLGIQEATSQVVRMYSSGAAAADMFRERGILAMLGFQAGVSTSAEETRKKLIEAYEDPASRFRGASELLARTWSGMMSMLSDAWFQFRNMVMEAGVFEYIKAAVQLLLDYIKQLKEEGKFEAWAQNMSDTVIGALEAVAKAVAYIADAFWGWQMIWEGLKSAFAVFAEYLNTGLAYLADIIDQIRAKINELGGDAAKVGKVLKFTPGMTGLGMLLEQLETSNVEIGAMGDQLRENAKFWSEVHEESNKALLSLAGQESSISKVEKVLEKIRRKAEQYKKELEGAEEREIGLKGPPEASGKAMAASSALRLKAVTALALTELNSLYQKGEKTLEEYFDTRATLLEQQYQKELALLQQRLALAPESKPEEKLKIEDQIFALQQKYEGDRIKLMDERTKAEQKAANDILAIDRTLADMRKALISGGAGSMQEMFDMELEELDRQHQEEIQKLTDLKATEAELEEAHRLQQLERDKVIADQRLAVQQATLEGVRNTLGTLEGAFADAYEASGQTIKEFFYLQKAAAIASTIISTYEAAQKAYGALAGIPYVGPALGVAAAAAAVAAGMARVGVIMSQKLAEGGVVEGHSPHSKADNINIKATAGEFMQPVTAVKYYGERGMEAIKKKLIPREVIAQYATNIKPPPANYTRAFQSGGPVGTSESSDQPAGGAQGQSINVVNVLDPNMMDQYVSTAHGQKNIVNVISQNAFAVKQIIEAE